MAATYREYPPPDALQAFIHCCWSYVADDAEPPNVVVPDGRPELILHLRQPYREADCKIYQPAFLFAGQLTRPLKLIADGPVAMVAVRFRPDGARAFLGFSVADATDRRLDMAGTLDGRAMDSLQQVLHSGDPDQAITWLQSQVSRRVIGHQPDPLIRTIVDDILGSGGGGGDGPIETDLSSRQVQRRFKQHVGFDARTFRAIRRFRSVFDRLREASDESWAQRALETGYFDQPQLARDFQRFLGCTAREWLRVEPGLAQAIASQVE